MNEQEWLEKVKKRLQNRNKFQLIRKKLMSGNEQMKIQNIVLNQLAKNTRLNNTASISTSDQRSLNVVDQR